MLEALCRQSSTTLDIVHAEDGPPITQRTSGLELLVLPQCLPPGLKPVLTQLLGQMTIGVESLNSLGRSPILVGSA